MYANSGGGGLPIFMAPRKVLDNVVDICVTEEEFLVLGKDYISTVDADTALISHSPSPFDTHSIQIMNLRCIGDRGENSISFYSIVLNDDGSVHVMTFDFDTLETGVIKVNNIPPVCYMVGEGEEVVLVDVNNHAWKVASVIPDMMVEKTTTPTQTQRDRVRKRLIKMAVDLDGVSEMYGDVERGLFFIIRDNGQVDKIGCLEYGRTRDYHLKWERDYYGFRFW